MNWASWRQVAATLSPAEVGRAIEQAVREFEGATRPHDDLSLMLVRVA